VSIRPSTQKQTESNPSIIITNISKMVTFGDLTTSAALQSLNEHLASRSYVGGYIPSQADVTNFTALPSTPDTQYVHIARWYRHIKSFTPDEHKAFPASAEPAEPCCPAEPAVEPKAAADDDDFDLFGDDDEDEEETEEEKKIKEERVAAYNEKKATKKAVIAKSSILLDCKPWDDETDMKKMEELVRSIKMDGLIWGQSKLVPVGYGIKKLQIGAVIEDDKVSTETLEEEIVGFEDYVQSMDIAAFNKI
jgi:elongation factor 1-beta